jgi:uncharacterized cysteine cluster protein YcgN (CxxCxxCC family)
MLWLASLPSLLRSNMSIAKFWEMKKLHELSHAEWEALCDGCGLCCLVKVEDEDSGERYYTRLACRLLVIDNCRCSDYRNRHEKVSDCLKLTPTNVGKLDWLPPSCAYRLIEAEEPLPDWHPLVSGDPESVRKAGISIHNWAISEDDIDEENLHEYVLYEVDL